MSNPHKFVNRFGYGLRASEVAEADSGAWLAEQIRRYDPKPPQLSGLASRNEVAQQLSDYLDEVRSLRKEDKAQPSVNPSRAMQGDQRTPAQQMRRMAGRAGRNHYQEAVTARFALATASDTPFAERLVHFWANHFAVSADKLTVVGLAGWLEFEAIRPHVFGHFSDMLHAVEAHPAMLLYLDQAQSIGPNSPVGARITARGVRKVGLNENLAREILELHTLGVRSVYSQADVTEFAKALTGRTVTGLARGPATRAMGIDANPGNYAFSPAIHEAGERQLLGRRYAQTGELQAKVMLDDLAIHPATARNIATKLARHFSEDEPSKAMVFRLEKEFIRTKGDLKSLYSVLLKSPELWTGNANKFKTPWDWAVSAVRATAIPAQAIRNVPQLLNELGQPVWRPKSPAGYDDVAQSWAAPDSLYRRVEAAERLVRQMPAGIDPRRTAEQLFGANLSTATAQAIARAESPQQGMALLLCSPEFLRR